METILYEKRGRTAIITINRPEVMNAYDHASMAGLARAAKAFMDDPELWTAIVTGAGERSFSTGSDMKEAAADYASGKPPFAHGEGLGGIFAGGQGIFETLNNWKPFIAAINGYCVGGGLELAMCCDIRVAADHALFEVSEPKVGMIPGISPVRLPRLIPFGQAMELLLTARRFTAQEAYRLGLVNKVVPMAELMPTALALADEINRNAPLAVRAMKEIAWTSIDMSLGQGLLYNLRYLNELLHTEDSLEGTRAFVEKRAPDWKAK